MLPWLGGSLPHDLGAETTLPSGCGAYVFARYAVY